jgi:hypothetical protein
LGIAEVVDRVSLEAYLDGLPTDFGLRTVHYFAQQMGARIAPVSLVYFSRQEPFLGAEDSPLPIFGAIATAFTVFLDELNPIAAHVAALAARELQSKAPIGVTAATSVVSLAAAVANATANHSTQIVFESCSPSFARVGEFDFSASLRGQIIADSVCLATGQQGALWINNEMPLQIADDWAATCKTLEVDKNDWRFWIAFYNRLLAGKNIHADLLAPILSNLTKEDWLGDPALVTPLFDDVLAVYDAEDAGQTDLEGGIKPTSHLKTVRAQVSTLQDFLEAEYLNLSGHNARSSVQDELLEILKDLKALVEQMSDRFEAVENDAQALIVVQENLPAVVQKAGELAIIEPEPQINPTVMTMSATVKPLVDAGADPKLATQFAMSEAAGSKLWPRIQSLFGRKPE